LVNFFYLERYVMNNWNLTGKVWIYWT